MGKKKGYGFYFLLDQPKSFCAIVDGNGIERKDHEIRGVLLFILSDIRPQFAFHGLPNLWRIM